MGKISLNSLANKNPSFKDILKIIFGLSNLEINLMELLISLDSFSCINFLVDNLGKDRSQIQKALKKLYKLHIIKKKKVTNSEFSVICKNMESEEYMPDNPRGYRYIYSSISKDEFKEKLKNISKKSFEIINTQIQNTL